MECLYAEERQIENTSEGLQETHAIHSRPDWIARVIGSYKGRELHQIQTYRLAVRQELRKRGLPVTLGS